ncbi:MAG TPA: hypothetical protein VFG68_19190 [Fimbriiglobus sp.]|nr:hypothetical protein [Fimbriiglobus sp.]
MRHLTRLAFFFPLRCRHCQIRFWRLTLSPPPFARPRRRGPVHSDPGSDALPEDTQGSAVLPAPG